MKTIKNLINSAKTPKVSTENKNLIAIRTANAKSHREAVMSHNEMHNNSEQNYYNKASNCSVKAQKDNLFDYYSFLDN
jgi:hypothetical protein